MINIETDRLIIRNFVFEDWEELRDIIIDKESSEYAIYDYQFPTSVSEVQDVAKWFSQGSNYLAVLQQSHKKLIGFIALNGATPQEMDLGFCIHSSFQRKGYGAEACSAVINYAFNVFGTEHLTSGTANANYPSCRLLAKLGFKKTAEGIASFRKTPDGTPIDFIGSAFLLEKDEWLHDIGDVPEYY